MFLSYWIRTRNALLGLKQSLPHLYSHVMSMLFQLHVVQATIHVKMVASVQQITWKFFVNVNPLTLGNTVKYVSFVSSFENASESLQINIVI